MPDFDIVITNGTLVDPERKQITIGNIGIRSGKITAITRESIRGQKQIDAKLAIVSPGFIDIHTHVDNKLYAAQCMARQGVTTAVGGNCGIGPVNMDDFFKVFEHGGFPLNQVMFVGESFGLRPYSGAADPYKPATPEQLNKMIYLTEQGLEQGCVGISFGLEYYPGTSFEEITALSRVAAKYGKLVTVHLRSDGWQGLAALKEAINITRVTGAALQISHLVYMLGTGMMSEAIRILDEAVETGLNITADSGMYHSFATFIGSAVFDEGCIEKWGCSYNDLLVCSGIYTGERCTRELYEILRTKYPNEVVTAMVGNEAEVLQAFEPDYVMVSSDGGVGDFVPGTGHPQNVGTFPRFFNQMVREYQKLSLLKAVTKCTLLPAERLGLKTKGRLREGCDADIVIFNLDRIADRASFISPDTPPDGIDYVIVGGQLIVEDGKIIETSLPGQSIRLTNSPWSW